MRYDILGPVEVVGDRARALSLTSARGRRRARIAAAAVVVLVAIARSGEPQVVVPADSLVVIDAVHNRIVDAVPVGGRPTFVAAGAGAVWVANINDRTMSRVDRVTLRVTATSGSASSQRTWRPTIGTSGSSAATTTCSGASTQTASPDSRCGSRSDSRRVGPGTSAASPASPSHAASAG